MGRAEIHTQVFQICDLNLISTICNGMILNATYTVKNIYHNLPSMTIGFKLIWKNLSALECRKRLK